VIIERRFNVLVLMLVLATAVQGVTAAGQAQPAYTLSVTKDGGTFVNLKAKDAKLADVAAELAIKLAAKVIVAPSLKDEKITVDIAGTPVEPAMLSIAPRVFVDYEVRRDAPPAPLGIYLLGLDDPEPSQSAVVQGTSQGLMVSGNTEDTGKPDPNAPLRITYDKGRLSVFAKEQSLMVVVMSIADELGVPAEIRRETREIVNVNIKETVMIDDALAGLSDSVRVYIRVDAGRLEKRLLRVVIGPPAAK
jgi:hypothetical protein